MSNTSAQNQQNNWQLLYKAALLRKDSPASEQRILKAESAIALRRSELDGHTGQRTQVEKEAMEAALYVLKTLRSAQFLCRICGKPLVGGTAQGSGDRVHEHCHALKLKLEQATVGTDERRANQEKLAIALRMLFDLLEEYAPLWYTQEHHDTVCAALASSRNP